MKYGKKRVISEVPLINLISREDLDRLNKRFGTFYKPKNEVTTAKIIIETRLDELDRLMRQKPERGGYGA
jgi:hypothetical protein